MKKKDCFLITCIMGGIYALFLGSYPLFSPDEARYAEIAREMLTLKQYIVPHLNGVIYLEKPVLFYWLQTLPLKFLGFNEWAMRFWPVVLAIAGCLTTYYAGCRLYNRRTGLYSAAILATSPLYFAMGHFLSLDMPISVFMAIGLLLFLVATTTHTRYIRWYMWGAAISIACAVLTKGFMGIVLPLTIIGLWVIIQNKWRDLKYWHLPSSIIIFLAIALPWHMLIQLQCPDFFHFYVIQEHISRFTTGYAARSAPPYFFIPVILLGFLPWSIWIFRPLWHSLREGKTCFLSIWILIIFIFFSFSESKLIPYMLPLFPALALLTGQHLARKIEIKWFIGICTIMIITLLTLYLWAQKIITQHSVKPLALQVQTVAQPHDAIVSYAHYFQALPFYTQRRIILADCSSELDFGASKLPQPNPWFQNKVHFWKWWPTTHQRIFAIMRLTDYEKIKNEFPHITIYKLAETADNVLLSNLPYTRMPKSLGYVSIGPVVQGSKGTGGQEPVPSETYSKRERHLIERK